MWRVRVYWLNGEMALDEAAHDEAEARAKARYHASRGVTVQIVRPDGTAYTFTER